jgi:uncharacterized protein (TIGR02391 family)
MNLHELIPDPEALISLESEELGLRMLKVLATYRSSEFLHPATFIKKVFGEAPFSSFSNPYPGAQRDEIGVAIREAWAWLKGAALLVPFDDLNPSYSRLSRKGRLLAEAPDPIAKFSARTLPKQSLHPSIHQDVWANFHRGKFETAVFEAMREVEVAVRQAADLGNDAVGVSLMTAAFKEGGPLADSAAQKGEQIARMNLFAGAIGSYKNPLSHGKVQLDDPEETIELILLASHLLRIVDARRDARAASNLQI